ncbi:MAG: helix-turn-helix domain-containing protein [Acidimicrobiia bacterium]
MVTERIETHVRDVGEFIREQRRSAQLSVRRLAELAGVSNPYLSQIERGLRKPSAEILHSIAGALRISAETLYERAGFLDPAPRRRDVEAAVLTAGELTERQKQVLLEVYRSFLRRDAGGADDGAGDTIADATADEPGQAAGTR